MRTHTAKDHCLRGHCKVLRLPDGATGATPNGECRRCARARQVLWVKTEKGQASRDRYESKSKAVLRNLRYAATQRGDR